MKPQAYIIPQDNTKIEDDLKKEDSPKTESNPKKATQKIRVAPENEE